MFPFWTAIIPAVYLIINEEACCRLFNFNGIYLPIDVQYNVTAILQLSRLLHYVYKDVYLINNLKVLYLMTFTSILYSVR